MPNLAAMPAGARTARRYRSERVFRSLCSGAIAVTALFLAFLLFSLARQAVPALTMATTPLTVTIDPALIDPAAPAAGDFPGIVRAAMVQQFPKVEVRADRKKLLQLISAGVAERLQRQVVANPALIGTQISLEAPLSADADMYLKGQQGKTGRIPGHAALSLTADGDSFKLQSPGFTFGPGQLILVSGGALRVTDGGAVATAEPLVAPDPAATVPAGQWQALVPEVTEDQRRTSDREVVWLEQLQAEGKINSGFNWPLLTNGDSRAPEQAGLRGAFIGSVYTLLLTLFTALPLGVAAALYLEEFAPKNRFTDLIEVNINNLAAVPSIIFGLLGLAVFLNIFGLPRSSPLVGGLVLALLVLPTFIIAARAALRAVPPSIKEAALGVGASHQQAVFQHMLPLALPGILTGTILGMARALGETAPLLMIGMIAFIADIPGSITDAATVLPVQVYLWSSLPEAAFRSRTSAAILVLLLVLLCFNALAIWLRNKFERRW